MKSLIRKFPLIIAASALIFTSCDDDDSTDGGDDVLYSDIMASQIKSDIVDDASISPYEAIFDVSPSYDAGHLPFATNAGSVDGLGDMLNGLDKDKNYLVYCHGDAPSIAGAELMIANGFENVHRLYGNYGAWNNVSFVDIAPATVKSKMDAGDFGAIFDVSPAYTSGHLPGATNANESGGGTSLESLIADMDKDKTYLVYCHGDAPAMAGAQLMEDAGFMNVYRLEGNYGAWVEAGYDVEMYSDIMASMIKSYLVDDASITPYAAIFDVSPNYDAGHLPFATNAGSVDGLGNMLDGLDKSLNYLVYCHGDAPSIAAAELMVADGFTSVHRLYGNYGAWNDVSFVDVAAATVKSKMDAGDFDAIFDVSPAYSSGHLPGAINANESGGGSSLTSLIENMDKNKTYLVYCHGNLPAMTGAQLMEDDGFKNVYRLEGNYGAWVDAGYAVD